MSTNTPISKIYDFEADWMPCSSGLSRKIVYEHVKRTSLFRIINMDKCEIRFSDIDRVVKIIDINKVLTGSSDPEKLKKLYQPLVNSVFDEILPITIPYEVKDYICYIEAFPSKEDGEDDIIGILYFREDNTDNMIEAKRFFKINSIVVVKDRYECITFEEYSYLKREWMKREETKVSQQ